MAFCPSAGWLGGTGEQSLGCWRCCDGLPGPFCLNSSTVVGFGSSAKFFPYHRGNTLVGELEMGIAYGAVVLVLLSPSFTAVFLLVAPASRSLLAMSSPYKSVLLTLFRVVSHHSVLRVVMRFAWLISIDL